ncbi:deacetylvindoline O-acetyltransferase [Tanacetum coccineum]
MLSEDVSGCDVMITGVKLKKTLDVTEVKVGYPGKVESGDGSKEDENCIASPLSVQVTHFACGGIAVATSFSDKIGDARSTLNFINDWAKLTAQLGSGNQKDASPISHGIIPSQARKTNLPEFTSYRSRVGCVTRSFIFSNQKLNDLKAKVIASAEKTREPIMNPTRVEVLSWLIHKCAVAAATQQNSGTFKATGMAFPVDMKNILVEKLPGTMVGNLMFMIEFPTRNQTELEPHNCIGEIRKQKIQFQNTRNLETATGIVAQMTYETALETSKRIDECYVYSSLRRFPTYRIDFGWGKPVKVTVGGIVKRMTVLMDTPNDDGIEAIVCLQKEDMKTFQRDPELRAFC